MDPRIRDRAAKVIFRRARHSRRLVIAESRARPIQGDLELGPLVLFDREGGASGKRPRVARYVKIRISIVAAEQPPGRNGEVQGRAAQGIQGYQPAEKFLPPGVPKSDFHFFVAGVDLNPARHALEDGQL